MFAQFVFAQGHVIVCVFISRSALNAKPDRSDAGERVFSRCSVCAVRGDWLFGQHAAGVQSAVFATEWDNVPSTHPPQAKHLSLRTKPGGAAGPRHACESLP